jgi:hypothetical protein
MQYIKGADYYKYTKNIKQFNFNYAKRKWSIDKYKFKRFSEIFPVSNSKIMDLSFNNIPKFFTNTLRFEEQNETITYGRLREKIHKLTMLNDVIQFKMIGMINREVGQLIAIDSLNPLFVERYKGIWIIERVYHKFSGGSYTNEIIATRVEKLKTADKKDG